MEKGPGRAGSPAEVTVAVFLSVNHILVFAHTLGRSILTRVYGKTYVSYWVTDHANTGPLRVITAIFWRRVKGGADYLACPATIAQVGIDPDRLDYLLSYAHFL